MYCSACGQAIAPGQGFCQQCVRPAVPPVPPVPGLQFQIESYASKVKALSVVWFIYSGLALVTGFMGLAFARAFLSGHFGPWVDSPWAQGTPPPVGSSPSSSTLPGSRLSSVSPLRLSPHGA